MLIVSGMLALAAGLTSATSIVPITDQELYARADAIVHGVVVSNTVGEDAAGRPETVTRIAPLAVLKGQVSGSLVLHQLGGTLPDGRFFKLWGRPEYPSGHEVIVFAIARPEGDYQTAELLLGKYEIQQDEQGRSFAVPALVADTPGQVTVTQRSPGRATHNGEVGLPDETLVPRELNGFLRSLRSPEGNAPLVRSPPQGTLTSIVHPEYVSHRVGPNWVAIGGLWRWNNGATAVWTLDGQANITGDGIAEAANATVTWDAEPDSTINYTIGTGGANPIHLDALSSPCGWSTCMSGGGVIGCGGPGGGGFHSWRGEGYETITNGEVWLRSYCTLNLWDSITTQSTLTHELGHTLGLGHSDDGASPHDVCAGDENAATMRSFVQYRTTLGTDDQDAVRWLYGDGGNWCNGGGPTLTVTRTGAGTGTVASAPAGISCGTACSFSFASGTMVTLSATPGTNSVFSGWGGDADCSDGTVTMSAARNCTANFDPFPDLLISALTVSSSAVAGSTISISETTKNQAGPAAASLTSYYLSTNSTYEAGDTLVGSRNVPALATGATSPAPPGFQLTIPGNTATGNYYVIAKANAGTPPIGESNPANNTKANAIHIGPPDLVVSSLSATATSGVDLAITITATDTTHDQSGTGPASPTVTRFYLSTDTTLGSGDVSLGFRNVPALQPNGSNPGSTSLPVPSGTVPGTYYVIAKANADNPIPETSTTNNTRSIKIVIGPDLIVSSLSAPATGGAGLPIDVTDTTRNLGTGSAAASTTRFYLSANATLGTGDVPLGGRAVGILVPNGMDTTMTKGLTIPAGTLPGTYYIIAVADDGGAVPETSDTNNTRAVVIRLSPDLIVSALTVPLTAAAGATIQVSDTTRNQGAGSAIATKTKYYLSTNTTFDPATDVYLGSRDVPILLTGVSNVHPQTGVPIPSGTAAGNYFIIAVADANNDVHETNEGNNTTAKPITISAP